MDYLHAVWLISTFNIIFHLILEGKLKLTKDEDEDEEEERKKRKEEEKSIHLD